MTVAPVWGAGSVRISSFGVDTGTEGLEERDWKRGREGERETGRGAARLVHGACTDKEHDRAHFGVCAVLYHPYSCECQ